MAVNTRMTSCKTPDILVRKLWDESTKNAIARAYIVGVIDALCWNKAISDREHDKLSDWIETVRA